jgi:amidase
VSLADEIRYLGAADMAAAIRRRELSPVEVLDATLAAVASRGAALNAFVHVAWDEARARARQADRAVMAGEPLGPLHGCPRP